MAANVHTPDNQAAFGSSDSVLLHARRKQRNTDQDAAARTRSRIARERSVGQDFLDGAAKHSARSVRHSDQGVNQFLPSKFKRLSPLAYHSCPLGVGVVPGSKR